MCTYFNTKIDVAQNLANDFFLTLTVREPFHSKDYRKGYGVNFWKNKFCTQNLPKERKHATSSYSETGDSLQYIYSVPVTKNHQNIKIFLHRYFLSILIMVKSSYTKEKWFVAASILCSCGYLFLLWKGVQNDVHCNSIKPP